MTFDADLTAALAVVRAVSPRFTTASDDELLADLAEVEAVGRIVDAWRVAVAAQVEERSRSRLGEEALAFRRGARDGVELVQQTARIGNPAAKQRVAIGAALAPRTALNGDLLPGRFPAIAAAVESGRIGIESARVIVNAWKAIHRRVEAEQLDAMIENLVDTAATSDTETVRDIAAVWSLALDPDGAEPKEREQHQQRALKIGRTLLDGTTIVTLRVVPEHLAMLKEALASRRRGGCLIKIEAGSDADADTSGPEWREEHAPDGGDPRTRSQQDYDSAFELLTRGIESEEVDTSAAVTHETVITVTAAEVEARQGQGWAPGIMAGLPMPVIERRACTGGVRLLVTGDRGEVLFHSRSHRLFTPAQRRALTVAAGGRCQYPGCRTPAPFLEAHHADFWARDGGPTDVDNGIMLCSYHHHLVHAKQSPVEIRRHDGDLHIVPKRWTGPPDPRHRRQSGPLRDPRLERMQRLRDPDRWIS